MKTKFFFLLFLYMPILAYSQSPVNIIPATNVAGNAHYFVEGSIGVSYNSDRYSVDGTTTKLPTYLSFNISPKVGYWLNDKIAVGTEASFFNRITKRIEYDANKPEQEIEYKELSPGWQFSVFGRYKLWGTEKLSLLVESPIGIGGGITKEKTALSTKKLFSSSNFRISVFPAISYDLTDKFSFIATCSFFSLNYQYNKSKDETDGKKYTSSRLDFSVQPTQSLQLGIIYNF